MGSSIGTEEVREPSVKAGGARDEPPGCMAPLWSHTPGSVSSSNRPNLQQIVLIWTRDVTDLSSSFPVANVPSGSYN